MKTALLEFPIFNQMTKIVVNYIVSQRGTPLQEVFVGSIRSAVTGVVLNEFDAIINIAKLECEKLEGIKGE